LPGALPRGRNSPQRAPLGLYAELLSGSAFTAPRAHNRRSWLYRRQPSVVVSGYTAYAQPLWLSGAAAGVVVPPDPMRWHPFGLADTSKQATDFIDGLRTVVANGDPDTQCGMAALVYGANTSMTRRALVNADGEMLLVPQAGRLQVTTEMGVLQVAPGQVLLLPRGVAFKVALLDAAARGYVCENYGAPFVLPELGPIGSNGLANPRDFVAPHAAYEDAAYEHAAFEPGAAGSAELAPYQIIKKIGGHLWQATQAHTPFNVVAWHGNLTPYVYDTANFMAVGSISFDHPDPSIFTVLTSPSDTPGTANCDFVIFPPRWLVAEDTFRPPWYHRNVMSEFMGLVHGQYDAKPEGFKPGGASLHNSMVPHGPDADAFDKASQADLAPQHLSHTLAFMFESRWRLQPTAWAVQAAAQKGGAALDAAYAQCWAGLKDSFKPT
jgi:homogentisate 1,2-dioxygenase